MSKEMKRNANNIKYNYGINNAHNYRQSPEQSQSCWLLRYLHWKIWISDIQFNVHGLLIYYTYKICLSLTQYLCVADNAGDAVLLYVSASSERQEWRNETGAMKKTTELNNVAHSDACGPSVLCFYTTEHLVMQVI